MHLEKRHRGKTLSRYNGLLAMFDAKEISVNYI